MQDGGWDERIGQILADDFARDVHKSFFSVCSFTLVDLDTDMKWDLKFVNDKSMWLLSVHGSDSAEVLDDDRKEFFKSPMFRNISNRASDYLVRAKKTYDEILTTHLDDGEMLQVDEVKLADIMFWIGSKEFMDNLISGKYMM